MNRSIIALKEMINFSNIQRESMFVGLRHIFLALLLLTAGAGSAWADTWDGTTKTAPDMSTNKGTSEELAIQISTAAELAWLGDQMRQGNTATGKTYGNKYWKLMADIDLGGNSTLTGHDWASMIGHTGNAFCGYFDGNNKTVSNIQVAAVTSTKYYGLFPSIQGKSTTDLSTVHDLNISGVFIKSTVSCAANTRIGGLVGYAKQVNITKVEVSNVNFTFTNTVTNTTQLGGAIGCMENNTVLNNVDAKDVTASFANTTTGLYVGGIVGASTGTANTNSMTGCDAKTVKVTHTSNITGNTYIGGLVGQANTSLKVINNNTVAGQSSVNGGKAFDVSVSGSTVNFYAGGLLGYTIGDGHEVKNNTVEKVYITNTGTINGGRLGGFIGYVESNGTSGKVLVKGNTATTVSITAKGNTAGATYLGGFVGYVKGKASPDNRTLIQGNTVTSPTVTMNGVVGHTYYQGGFIGYVDTNTDVLNNKVATPTINITNDINVAAYVGGAVGAQNGYTTIDGMVVDGGTAGGFINGPSTDKNVTNGKTFMVGGFIGMQNNSGTADYQPNKFKNIAVSGMTINLAHYVPQSTISNHKFAVGGIAGTVNTPNQDFKGNRGIPENLIAKSVKIYAPYAATSPTVANFGNSNATYSNYTGENSTAVDAVERSKSGSWLYSDYQLGLSKSVLTGTLAYNAAAANGKVRRNYSASATTDTDDSNLEWLTVDDNTFLRKNRYLDNERESKTVLWWTRTENNASYANNDIEQNLYPQNGNADADKNPFATSAYKYYMYFYQGVANAKHVESAKADLIISGIDANVIEAAKAEPLTLAIVNEQEGQRGFAARTITVTPSSAVDSYKWYVDGVEQSATGNSITVKPDWKLGKNIHVNAIKNSQIVASAAYTLKVGVLKTKNSADLEGMAIADRGTSTNPYIIDSEEALRQLSYLSTVSTGILWEGIVKPVAPYVTNQSQGHYNRAYYELEKDITMSSDPFVPISHMGYNNSGSDGSYSANFIFQGHFDGKGYKISGLKITWGAGQYNGNDAHVYHGLFGAVGAGTATAKWGDGSTVSPTVIKNLKIANATLTHDTNNTSFYYNNGTSGNSNNCYVGVLAGIVSNNTTIQNIEISGSSITDAGSSEYKLATRGLYVGGAIGSVQYAFATTGTAPTAIDIQHIAASVDITLTHAAFADETAKAQVGLFNVGGIVGRYMATSATAVQMQAVMPKYIIYSGDINAEKAWISPVIAATRFTGQNGGDYKNFSKQWEGNNADAASQINITNAQYYNFKIHYDGNYKDITEEYPSNKCKLGFRVMNSTSHADGQDDASYEASKYQGVNYAARYVAANSTLELLNKERTDGYSFVWDGDVVKMTTNPYVGISLSREAATNKFTAVMEGAEPTAYKWEVSFDGLDGAEHWHTIDGMTSDTYTVPVSLKTKYVRASATLNGTDYPYTTLYEIVEADKDLCNPQITKTVNGDNTDFTFSLNQKNTDPKATLTANYTWYQDKSTVISSATANQKLTLSNTDLASDTYKNVVFCKVTVTELGVEVADYFLVNGATVIYVNGNGYTGKDENGLDIAVGNDSNNGLTPQSPVLTINKANSLLKSEANGGTIDNNIIVIMGILNNDYVFHSSGTNPATFTGKHGGHDYKGVIRIKQVFPSGGEHNVNAIDSNKDGGTNCYVLGDTKFEDLMFYGMQEGNAFIELHGRDVIFGKGLVMQNFKNLSLDHGNMNNSETIPEFTIILYATNLTEEKIREYTNRIHTRGTPQTVTFQSGHYGRLMGGRFTQKFFLGGDAGSANNTAYSILASADRPVWAVVNVEIDENNEMTDNYGGKGTTRYSRDVNAIIAGLTDGSMYGDYTINFYGGNVAYIVGANQGNPVKNGTENYTPKDGTTGSWGQFPNASYFGRTIINIDQKSGVKDITVGNLYAGGLGRKVQTGSASAAVDMYVYGQTVVNVKNGTVSGSVYGGGVGGVLGVNPWDAHVPYATTADDTPANAIINKVQYGDNQFGGTWSSMTKDSPMAKVKLHNLKESGDGYDTEDLDLRNTSTTVNISGGQVNGNVYGGGYGYVQDMPTGAAVQGVGSVFGTANINITGGTISGNIYGGSQGHTYYYNQTNQYGQILNHIAEMNGTVNINVTGTEEKCPTIKGDIYGAGQGIPSGSRTANTADVAAATAAGQSLTVGTSYTEEYNRIATTGNADLGNGNEYKSTVNITIDIPDTKAIEGNVYGGGRMGAVDGDINVILNGGQINGNVYGGGKGENGHLQKARVNGTTNVTLGY